MTLTACSKDGKYGWKWGDGACYVGEGAKKKAIRLGLSLVGPEKFAREAERKDYLDALACAGTMKDKVAMVMARKK